MQMPSDTQRNLPKPQLWAAALFCNVLYLSFCFIDFFLRIVFKRVNQTGRMEGEKGMAGWVDGWGGGEGQEGVSEVCQK